MEHLDKLDGRMVDAGRRTALYYPVDWKSLSTRITCSLIVVRIQTDGQEKYKL